MTGDPRRRHGTCWTRVATFGAAVLTLARAAAADPPDAKEATVRFVRIANSAFDRYTKSPTPSEQRWMRAKYWRMLAYSPYFDVHNVVWYVDRHDPVVELHGQG